MKTTAANRVEKGSSAPDVTRVRSAAYGTARKSGQGAKGKWVFVLILALLFVYLFLPVAATLLFSVAGEWQTEILPKSYTLKWYGDIFSDPRFLQAVGHTLLTGCLTVGIALIVLVPVIFVLVVYFPKWEKLLQISILIPFAFPPVVSAIGLIKIYSSGPVPLTGTIWILIGVYFILIQPFIYQSVRNSLLTIRAKELVEAAEVLGAAKMTAFRTVVLPNILSGTLIACLLSFSMIFGEFVMSNMLVGGQYETIQMYLYNEMKISGQTGSAIVITYFLLIFILSGIVLKLGNRKPKGYTPAKGSEEGEA
ncbi:ABC transporter permease [Gorillibacterium massiliense]|uniref:ABC transporter permease n=1 Tax=Gorillibacterium massiliense TaxID=1280390 RepID=UPI0004AE71D4|nr:ABC transporter permease [Gorillibacterium massiliense]